MKKHMAILLSIIAALSLAACQETLEKQIVIGKNKGY